MKSKIVFTQEFTSPSLGNVWLGREAELPNEVAAKYVNAGLAEYKAAEFIAPISKIQTGIDDEPQNEIDIKPVTRRGRRKS